MASSSTSGGLPLADKSQSENPGKNAVTQPVNPAAREADINRKMQAFGVLQAFRDGKYPSNKQIDETLQYVLNNSPINDKQLSNEGRELIGDVQSIIETARQMVVKKNADELFQNFLWETRKVDNRKVNPVSNAGGSTVNAPLSKDDLNRDGQQAAEHLKTLGKLIFTNSEVRKLLKDVGLLARDVAADGAAKAASHARPDEHQLRQVDETAPDNQWVGKNGETLGPNQRAPDTGLAEKREHAKQKKDEYQDQASNAAQRAKEEGQHHAQDTQNRMQGAVYNQPGPNQPDYNNPPTDAQREAGRREGEQIKEEKKNVASQKINSALDRIPQEHKDRARDARDRTKNYLDEKFPQERRDRFIYRLKKVVVEQQRHQDYQEAMEFLLNMAENYTGAAQDVTRQTAGHSQNVRGDANYQRAEQNLRTLLERFANNSSMDPIFHAINDIYADVRNDPELRSWFRELDSFVRKALLEPGYVMRDESDREARRLRENGKGFFQERYRPHRENLTNSIQDFFQAYADDPLNVQFGEDWKRLSKDLLFDSDGNLQYKPHLWQDIRQVIIPTLAQRAGYIPIPRIEYTDDVVDLVIENLTLETQNSLPNVFEIEAKNYFKLSPYNAINDVTKHSVYISFSQIQADIRDVAFYFKKKSGFPKLSDSGIADVLLSGKGISGAIHLESTPRPGHAFVVRSVKVKVDALKFKIRESKHNFLYNVVRPLATGLIKKTIEKAMEDAIRNGLDQVNQQVSDIKERLDDAAHRDDISRRDVLKDAFARRKEEGERKAKIADEKTGEFKISADRSSKLVNWESPHSLVGKQAERVEQSGHSNQGWKSPAFDIAGHTAQRI